MIFPESSYIWLMFKAEKQQENGIKLQVKIFTEQNFPKAQQPNGMRTPWARAHEQTIQPKATLNEWIKKKNHVFQRL